jgi:hypothetical protein
MRLSTTAASVKNAIIPQKATAPAGEVNHFENSNSANPAAASNAGGHHGDLRNIHVATAAVSARGPAKRAQPCAQGTRSLEVSYRPKLMTNTSPVVAADQMALAKDQSAGSSKMAPAANAAFPYCSRLKRFMEMLVELMADCCRRGGQCARAFLSRCRRTAFGRTVPHETQQPGHRAWLVVLLCRRRRPLGPETLRFHATDRTVSVVRRNDPPMLRIFILLLGLMFSQWLGDAVRSSYPNSWGGWIASFATQYICCVFLVAWFDQAVLLDCLRAGLILTCGVRWLYFMKRL